MLIVFLLLSQFNQACAEQAQQAQQKEEKRVQIKGKGIKVAILDMGINLENSWISSKAGRIQCWLSEDACILTKSLTRRTKVPVANKSASGVYKSATKAITLTVMEGL